MDGRVAKGKVDECLRGKGVMAWRGRTDVEKFQTVYATSKYKKAPMVIPSTLNYAQLRIFVLRLE